MNISAFVRLEFGIVSFYCVCFISSRSCLNYTFNIKFSYHCTWKIKLSLN